MMNEMIRKLAEIESAAAGVMDSFGAQKTEIAKESEARMKDFDTELQNKIDSQLTSMKEQSDKEIQAEILQMKEDSKRRMESLEKQYQDSHTAIAQGIVNMLIGA